MSDSFWRGRRVFVTGHTGFKGSWLTLWLLAMGARVTGFALPPPTRPSLFDEAEIAAEIRHVEGDVRDSEHLARELEAAEPEVVFHLAAQPIVRTSYREPLETLSVNVLGTASLLDAVRRSPAARAVVVVTSDKCYENREWNLAYHEGSELGGHDPYSASKACAELVTSSFRRSYFETGDGPSPAAATVRAGNVVGGGDWADDRIVPDTIRSLTGGPALELRYPNAIRPWQLVLEPLSGYLALAEKLHDEGPTWAEAWNFAPREEDAKSVGWLVDRLHRAWGSSSRWGETDAPQPHEAIYLKLDATKAAKRLAWRPRLDIEHTVAWVTDWYRRFDGGESARAITHEQIRRYQRLA
ncbi:MAG: CDP-glucose 4,6-dehydratase [Acidobacteria bacterium]|nr:CDP-glucose 4,6-dehydratase [Acidobacteriota bacterium]MCB9378674.1 CDP-glucose 4,6-dehydratase [Holophagales bacterium]